jgi:hypothetical protein
VEARWRRGYVDFLSSSNFETAIEISGVTRSGIRKKENKYERRYDVKRGGADRLESMGEDEKGET